MNNHGQRHYDKPTDHYTDGRRWSYISSAWIFEASWNSTEEIARLNYELDARTRALTSCEQQLIELIEAIRVKL